MQIVTARHVLQTPICDMDANQRVLFEKYIESHIGESTIKAILKLKDVTTRLYFLDYVKKERWTTQVLHC